jgi:hypothetical protein
MELFFRILRESFEAAKNKPWWLGFAFLQALSAVLFSVSVKFFFYGRSSSWFLLILANISVSASLAFLWPRIKKIHEEKKSHSVENEISVQNNIKVLWVQSFILCAAFSLILLALRFVIWDWSYSIFITSLIAAFLSGVLLFYIIYQMNLQASFRGSVDLWLKKTHFPVLTSFGLMIGNSLSLMIAKTLFLSLITRGFSEIVAFAKIWSLALIAGVAVLFFIVWFNCLVVIGFMEITKPGKRTRQEIAAENVLLSNIAE